ncbi:MAG: HD-GYP domain-containing protein [Spirochaetota bacterium]|nr:HD-GYP domain-containing protein [Spirochaetota bacterium]
MKKIPVEELKPGMRFSKPIYIDSNNMYVVANVSIKESDIKKLMQWGVNEIETAGEIISTEEEIKQYAKRSETVSTNDTKVIFDDYNRLLKNRKRLIAVHKDACTAVGEVYKAIKNDEPFTTDEIEYSLSNIIDLIRENNNIFLFLYGLDEGKNYLLFHSVNVTFYALLIGIALKYTPVKLRELGLSTLLIDAGMAKMPVYITHKQSNLTEQEYNLIKTHPLHGFKALRDLGNVREKIAIVSLQHHEQFDGKGYPRGLKGSMISEYARIAMIADSYEAQTVNRSFRKKCLFYHAMKQLLSSGANKFDPVILRVFLSAMSVYPIGSIVQLNDKSIGLVIGSMTKKPLRPLIKLIFDSNHVKLTENVIINLIEETSLYIVKALDERESGVNFLDVL